MPDFLSFDAGLNDQLPSFNGTIPNFSASLNPSPSSTGVVADNGALPSSNFGFADAIGGLWNNLKPVIGTGITVWGQTQVAKLNAEAQAKLNELNRQNPSIGSNQPAAAQAEANKTLLQKYLPPAMADGVSMAIPLAVIGLGLILFVFILRRLFK